MALILITVLVVAVAMFFLALGVIFGKRTPLKGSCGSVVDKDHADYQCEGCTCQDDGADAPNLVNID